MHLGAEHDAAAAPMLLCSLDSGREGGERSPMLEALRNLAHRALETKRGDSFLLIRLEKRFLRRVHRMLGSPLAPRERTEQRDAAPSQASARREPAPVMVYAEGDRNIRERLKI